MVFNDWEINVVYSGEHEVVTNEKSLFVIDEFYACCNRNLLFRWKIKSSSCQLWF